MRTTTTVNFIRNIGEDTIKESSSRSSEAIIAKIIADTCIDNLLTCEEMAELLGTEPVLLDAFMCGKALPNEAFLEKWKDVFGFDLTTPETNADLNRMRLDIASNVLSGLLGSILVSEGTISTYSLNFSTDKAIAAANRLIDKITGR